MAAVSKANGALSYTAAVVGVAVFSLGTADKASGKIRELRPKLRECCFTEKVPLSA